MKENRKCFIEDEGGRETAEPSVSARARLSRPWEEREKDDYRVE